MRANRIGPSPAEPPPNRSMLAGLRSWWTKRGTLPSVVSDGLCPPQCISTNPENIWIARLRRSCTPCSETRVFAFIQFLKVLCGWALAHGIANTGSLVTEPSSLVCATKATSDSSARCLLCPLFRVDEKYIRASRRSEPSCLSCSRKYPATSVDSTFRICLFSAKSLGQDPVTVAR